MENFLIGSKNELNSKVHPYLLFQEKTALLERIQSEIKTQTKNKNNAPLFQLNDIMDHYNGLQKKLDIKDRQKKQYKNPNDYDTLFEENYSTKQKEINKVFKFLKIFHHKNFKNKKQNNFFKEKYYENYIVNLKEIYDPETNFPQELEESNIILRMPHTDHKLDIDLEKIRKLNDQKNVEKIKHLNNELDALFSLQKKNEKISGNNLICKNDALLHKLLDKMKDGLLSSIIVYFDEIFDLLMDEILEEEVIFLNKLEEIPNNTEDFSFYEQETKRNKNDFVSSDVLQIFNQLSDLVDIK